MHYKSCARDTSKHTANSSKYSSHRFSPAFASTQQEGTPAYARPSTPNTSPSSGTLISQTKFQKYTVSGGPCASPLAGATTRHPFLRTILSGGLHAILPYTLSGGYCTDARGPPLAGEKRSAMQIIKHKCESHVHEQATHTQKQAKQACFMYTK
jgi:hypothetical protein